MKSWIDSKSSCWFDRVSVVGQQASPHINRIGGVVKIGDPPTGVDEGEVTAEFDWRECDQDGEKIYESVQNLA